MDHSFEEIRAVTIDLLAGRERSTYEPTQYQHLLTGVGEVFARREASSEGAAYQGGGTFGPPLSHHDRELFLEVFWGLFREGVITLGLNDSNREFPFCRITEVGTRMAAHQQAYFFHDVSSFEEQLRIEVPGVDEATLLYLKEAMQSFRAGCILAATVMLGVAAEHTFLLLLEEIQRNPAHSPRFASVGKERTILHKMNKFKKILEQESRNLPGSVKEDLDTHFAGILSLIRTFRNQAGHPTGRIVDREQAYVLLQLFIPYCSKMYQLMAHFSS